MNNTRIAVRLTPHKLIAVILRNINSSVIFLYPSRHHVSPNWSLNAFRGGTSPIIHHKTGLTDKSRRPTVILCCNINVQCCTITRGERDGCCSAALRRGAAAGRRDREGRLWVCSQPFLHVASFCSLTSHEYQAEGAERGGQRDTIC